MEPRRRTVEVEGRLAGEKAWRWDGRMRGVARDILECDEHQTVLQKALTSHPKCESCSPLIEETEDIADVRLYPKTRTARVARADKIRIQDSEFEIKVPTKRHGTHK